MRKTIGYTGDTHLQVIFDEDDQKIYVPSTSIRIFGVNSISDAIRTAEKNLKAFTPTK